MDSGWSGGSSGDDNGVVVVDTTKIPNITDLSSHLHSKGLKLGVYILPGAFGEDANKTVKNTDITIGSLFSSEPGYDARQNFDYTKDGVQQWHDSVVAQFVEWGVDLMKLDYMTPGSPDGGPVGVNTSLASVFYHNAIKNNNAQMRLDLSWKLDRSPGSMAIWASSADSIRLDQDINNSGSGAKTFVDYSTVLRVLENYRQFIVNQTDPSNITPRPDMDNTYIGNKQSMSGLSDVQRYTMAIHWIGAGANLITGSDETNRDDLGYMLLFDEEALTLADFTATYPMQPRNPEGWGTPGSNQALQCQAWIAGPNDNGTSVVILANYGPDPCLDSSANCSPTYGMNWGGNHLVNISFTDLGIGPGAAGGSDTWNVRRVWGGGGQGGADHTGPYTSTGDIQSWLGPGESVMYKLSPAS